MKPACFCLIAAALAPNIGDAGAWPREQGKTFLSFGTTITAPRDDLSAPLGRSYSLYGEHGLPWDLTLGIDLNTDGEVNHSALAFLRVPVRTGLDHDLFAYQVGLGARAQTTGQEAILQLGASWGRGFETSFGAGWVALDAQSQTFTFDMTTALKADLTIGVSPSNRWKTMVQFQAGDYPGSDPYLRLVPSVAWALNDRHRLTLAGQVGLVGDDRLGLSLGSWIEF